MEETAAADKKSGDKPLYSIITSEPEIERKFLLREGFVPHYTEDFKKIIANSEKFSSYPHITPSFWRDLKFHAIKHGDVINQGYLDPKIGIELASFLGINYSFWPSSARLRHINENKVFTLRGNTGSQSRPQIEALIDEALFEQYWPQTLWTKGGKGRILKTRVELPLENYLLHVDVYLDRTDLIVGEIEAKSLEELEKVPIIGEEVTGNFRYKNKNLAK